MKKILFAVPKGRISTELNPLLEKAGIIPEAAFFDESSRKIIFQTNRPNLEMIKVRSFDVATFVKFGAADIGVCGFDVLEEFSSSEIFPVLDLGIGGCRLSVAGDKESFKDALNLSNRSHIRIATKYVEIATKYFATLGIQAEAIKLNGAIEIAPRLKLCDVIVDLVSSGKTLAENNMIELQKIIDVTSHLIVNRSSFKIANEEINQIIEIFDVNK
jgi:ATP phosphoribosyltransferase